MTYGNLFIYLLGAISGSVLTIAVEEVYNRIARKRTAKRLGYRPVNAPPEPPRGQHRTVTRHSQNNEGRTRVVRARAARKRRPR